MGRSMRILLVIALSLVMLATPVSVAAANGNSTYAPYTYTFDEEYTAIPDAYAYTNKIHRNFRRADKTYELAICIQLNQTLVDIAGDYVKLAGLRHHKTQRFVQIVFI